MQLEDFRKHVPLIQAMREPGLRSRHWEQLAQKLGFSVTPNPDLTLLKLIEVR